MQHLKDYAMGKSIGRPADGLSYSNVADYIDMVGYGGIRKGRFNDAIPPAFWS